MNSLHDKTYDIWIPFFSNSQNSQKLTDIRMVVPGGPTQSQRRSCSHSCDPSTMVAFERGNSIKSSNTFHKQTLLCRPLPPSGSSSSPSSSSSSSSSSLPLRWMPPSFQRIPNASFILNNYHEVPRTTITEKHANKSHVKVSRKEMPELGLNDKQQFTTWSNLSHRLTARTLTVGINGKEKRFVVDGVVHTTPRWACREQ